MRLLPAYFAAWFISLCFTASAVAQETFVPHTGPIPSPGVAGTPPSVLLMDPAAPFLDGLSPQKADEFLNGLPAAEGTSRGPREVAVFRELSPSVVLVVTDKGSGSGSVISGGLILTNWHVVGDFKQVGVIYKPDNQGSQLSSANVVVAQVIRIDQIRDLALLKPNSIPSNIKPIELGDRNDFPVGADVHAIGHPSGEAWSYTKGIVSQVRENYAWKTESGIEHRAIVIQTQTPINPGNSGGPLLSDDMKMVGVNSFKAQGEALNFAVSVIDVRTFLAATSSVIASKEQCSYKILFEGRNDKNTAFIRRVSSKCDDWADLIFVLPDNKSEPMLALLDTKRRNKADGIVFDPSRSSKWKSSYWDSNLDDTFPLLGIHINGDLMPVRFEKRCKGKKAGTNFRCL